ncbi:MAG: proton-conducting transporter membrane subunit [Chloroflexi bacterium]|nr:proton-conducting transporter membrane subunit [Chloroflexota bacterium]
MLPAVVFAPFVTALLIPGAQALGVRARRLPGITMLALSAVSFAWLLALWPALMDGHVPAWSATWVPELGWTTAIRLDGLSHLFALLITGVGALVAWYGLGYLGDDERSARFFFALLAFQGGMLVAVTADDLMLLFIGWEVTSIASFALIGFSHERPEAVRSAQHALLVTASGGLAMLAGLVLLTVALDAERISEVTREAVLAADRALMSAALILIAIGALTKSAQFPFHGWLPGAMSAPTPVSAYLHSATMVKLGVYLVARFQPALGGLPLWGVIFPIAGGITLLLGAVLAVRERDLKRVLAYSTVSALGSMILLAGLGTGTAMAALVVTVIAHACYKAALFMVAGTIDHETGTRDRLLLGGLRGPMPLLGIASIVAAISMAGLPPAMGFLSKEKQLITAFGAPDGWLVVAAIASAGALTLVAAFAAGVAPFLGAATKTPKHAHEAPPALWVPPFLLAILGLVLGFAAPGLLGHALEPAVAAAAGRPYEVHLALWEGWNRVLAVSAVVIAGGGLLAVAHRRMPGVPWLPLRSDVAMDAIQDGILAGAGTLTRLSQHGNLPLYIATTMVIAVLPLAYLGGVSVGAPSFSPTPGILGVVSAAVIVVGSIAATTSRTRFRAIAALGAAR